MDGVQDLFKRQFQVWKRREECFVFGTAGYDRDFTGDECGNRHAFAVGEARQLLSDGFGDVSNVERAHLAMLA
jgi:hypothetical protein